MAEKLNLEDFLPQEAIEVLKQNNISYSVYEQDRKYYAELEWCSLHDGDQIFTIWFSYRPDLWEKKAKLKALRSFCKDLNDAYESFDVDDYVEKWLEARKTGQCHLSARQLVEDGENVDETLKTLSEEIWEVHHRLESHS